MESIFNITKSIASSVRRDIRVRWGLGAGASVLLSAGVLGLGGSLTPEFLQASTLGPNSVIPQERIEARVLDIKDMSTSTVFEVIQTLPKAERYEMMLYNSGADQALKKKGIYTVFVPASDRFDYLPKGYISSLSREETADLALGHITSGAVPMDESLNGDLITLGDTTISFKADAAAKTATVDGAKVLKVYKASNGYVYIIDKVLAEGN